jgi:hypothetical protein
MQGNMDLFEQCRCRKQKSFLLFVVQFQWLQELVVDLDKNQVHCLVEY